MVNPGEEGQAVVWDEGEVVEGFEGVNKSGRWQWSSAVVDEPAGNVGIETFGDFVEEVLWRQLAGWERAGKDSDLPGPCFL